MSTVGVPVFVFGRGRLCEKLSRDGKAESEGSQQ